MKFLNHEMAVGC